MNAPETRPSDLVSDYRIDLTRLMYMLYQDQEQQVARCDTKANLVLSANSILLAVVVGIATRFFQGTAGSLHVLLASIALGVMVLASILAIHAALSVAYPRGGRPEGQSTVDSPAGLFFSGHIASVSADRFVEHFLARNLEDVKREVLRNVHAKAVILTKKYELVRRGIWATSTAFAAWLVFILITVI